MAITISALVDQADRRTERRSSKELDLVSEFWMAFSEFCMEKRFPWRKQTFVLNTVVNTQFYDLSSVGLNIAPDFWEMTTLYNVQPGGSPGSSIAFTELTPMLSEDVITNALEASSSGSPSQYYIKPGTTQTLMLNAPANGIYKLRGNYWAIPEPQLDLSVVGDRVPLMPVQLTPLLVVALERRIFQYMLGQEDPRVIQVEARYRRAIALASKQWKYTTNAILEFSTQDQAIRAVDASTSGIDSGTVTTGRSG